MTVKIIWEYKGKNDIPCTLECGAGLKYEKEEAVYMALRRALLDYPKLLSTFPSDISQSYKD